MMDNIATHTIFSFMFILLIAGCQNNTVEEYTDKDGHYVVREWYNKSQIKSIKTFTNSEKTNFTYMAFYRDGTMRDSSTFIDEKINGIRKYYESTSGLMHIENYKNGLLNGPQKAVFSSGISSFEGFRKDNKKVGEWKFFYPNGTLITYEYYDSTGRLKYFKKYDQDGSILKTDGSAIIEVVLPQRSFKTQQPVSGYATVAIPDGSTLRLTIKDLSNGNNVQPFFDKNVVKSPVHWEKVFYVPGEKNILFSLIIKDDQTGKVEQSIVEQIINVEAN